MLSRHLSKYLAARRCTMCGINFPVVLQFAVCPIHDEPTTLRENTDPDEHWKERFDYLLKKAEADGLLAARVFPLARGVSVIEEDGRLFVDQSELHRAGTRLSRMQPDQFHLFELEDGWVYETQGWDEPRRRWWVDRVVEVSDA